jgi:hypothetical protein
MLPYLFGLGALLFLICGTAGPDAGLPDDSAGAQRFASCLIFGLILNHGLVLLFTELETSLVAGASLSVAGGVTLLLRYRRSMGRVCGAQWFALCVVLYLAALYVILGEPVSGWDARSIWYFHGKMIFYNGSVDAGGDWALPSLGFSHTDYPKLVPILAAQAAFVAGYWNEYLPKLSLVALFVPAMLLLIPLLRRKWWHCIFIAVPLLFTWPWLKNGYMDGYLAIYAGLAVFFLGRWLQHGVRIDFITGVLASGIVLDLKNEGMLYLLIIGSLMLLFLYVKRIRLVALRGVRLVEDLPVMLIAVSGWVLWERKKQLFHLKNDLQLGFHSLDTALQRLSEGALGVVLRRLYVIDNVNLSLGIFLLSLLCTAAKGRRPGRGALFCALAALLYFSGIVMIYLATPHDLLSFHLPTGNRTMLPVHMLLLAGSLSLLLPWSGAGGAHNSVENPPTALRRWRWDGTP